MVDPYVEKLADLILEHSLGEVDFVEAWENEQKSLLMTCEPPADELAKAVTKKVLKAGGNVILKETPSWFDYMYLTNASDSVLTSHPTLELQRLEHIAARLSVLSRPNTRSLATVDPEKLRIRYEALKPLRKAYMEVDENGNPKIPYCSGFFPTEGFAQDMEMPYDEYRDYIWKILYLDEDNPIDAYERISKKQDDLKRRVLDRAETLRIVDEEDKTDLEMSVRGHKWVKDIGKFNLPTDEIFNAPRKDSVEGVITFPKLPQHRYGGPEVSGIWLKFEQGEVVDYEARIGQDYITKMLQFPGATRLGEVALGLHPLITENSGQIRIDEKRGGTIHIAFGDAYRYHVPRGGDTSGLNSSSLHWDLIREMNKPSAYVVINGTYQLRWNSDTRLWDVNRI